MAGSSPAMMYLHRPSRPHSYRPARLQRSRHRFDLRRRLGKLGRIARSQNEVGTISALLLEGIGADDDLAITVLDFLERLRQVAFPYKSRHIGRQHGRA